MSSATSSSSHWVLRLFDERIALRLPVRAIVMMIGLMAALVMIFAVSLTIGSYDISLGVLLETLAGRTVSTAIDNVVWEFRLPRMLTAALAGAMMALSGAALQNVTRNGLADPSLVGVSQGAALAVILLIVLAPASTFGLRPLAAFGGALAVAALVQSLTWTRAGASPGRFILLGIGVAAFISSITSALMTYGQIDRALSALTWLSGSIHAATWADATVLALSLAVLLPLLIGLSRIVSVLRLGEATATGLGAPVRWMRYALITIAVALAAAATASVGPLGFVGLICPHAARRLARTGVGLHLVLTALMGAVLVALADLLGRSLVAPIQVPAGLVTAVIGVPVFIILLRRSAARSHL